MNKNFLEEIKTKKEKLEEVKIKLKDKFIGIDGVINKVIDNISLWYLTPEIQFRPLIISLWGITGVGKTDLVRTLVSLLNFTDKFIEIQMDTKNDYCKNIETYLENSGVDTTQPAILLLDEIQRYRTLNEHGEMIDNKYFNDIWMLLSDGKLQSNSQRRADIMELLLEEMYWQDQKDNGDNEEDKSSDSDSEEPKQKPKKIKNLRFHTGYWTAMRFKKLLGLKMPTDNIMELSSIERVEMLEEHLKNNNVNEGKSYEKLLIFISGNLDEAFKIANAVEDNEGDADIYHELSKRVSIINIKDALAFKFKPEQIARFGNNHIIYPCLDKKSYYKIIEKNCFQILNRIESEHNIKIELSDNIYDVIYRNGVFPTQGVRPVISTVFNVLGSNLPHFLYIALINNINYFYLDFENKILFIKINDTKYEKEIILDIDSLRENKSIDETTLITVHEIGHALAHAILFNTPPKQINVNAAGFNGGFVINHDSIDNKTFIRNQAAVYLGGLAAEEIVFGEEFKSSGSSYDILTATDIIGKYVRAYGMDMTISRIIKKETQLGHELNFNIDKTNDIIEMILMEEKKRIGDILNQNLKLYKALVKFTLDNKNITIEQFFNICKSFNLNLEMREINDKLIYKYNDNVKNFLSQ